ncbi:MAG: CheW domain-containing protein [Acaryochloridaceae cyanobacterium RL_2_7]|nr:CheW domain-containing protein [Acaryochloridaceae cyanobacterium RL_2_7]
MPTQTPAIVESQQFLTLKLPDATSVMIQSHQLMEVLDIELSSITSIPDVHPSLLGVYNWRGEVLWLLDLGLYLGSKALYETSLNQNKANIVIIRHNDSTLGLAVDQVIEMNKLSISDIQDLPSQDLHPMFQRCMEGYYPSPSQEIIWLINTPELLESISVAV